MNLYGVFIFLDPFISLCVIIITQIRESLGQNGFLLFMSQYKHSHACTCTHAQTHVHKTQTAYLFKRNLTYLKD